MTPDPLERFRLLQADEASRIIRDLNLEKQLVERELAQARATCEALRAELRRARGREYWKVLDEMAPTGRVLRGR